MIATITQELLNNLRSTALAATPGEWSAFIDMRSGTFAVHTPDDERKGNVVGWTGFDGDARSSKKQAAANARHVAAANPAVILALTDIAQNSLQSQEAQHPDDIAVDRFAAAMKEKLKLAREKGRGGWEQCSQAVLSGMLREHVEKGDPRDVANFCMMLWNNGAGIAAVPPWVLPAVAHVNPDSLDRFGKGQLSCCVVHAEPFVSEYPGMSLLSVPLYTGSPAAVQPVADEQRAMQEAWVALTGEEWNSGAGITRTLWQAAWRAHAAFAASTEKS